VHEKALEVRLEIVHLYLQSHSNNKEKGLSFLGNLAADYKNLAETRYKNKVESEESSSSNKTKDSEENSNNRNNNCEEDEYSNSFLEEIIPNFLDVFFFRAKDIHELSITDLQERVLVFREYIYKKKKNSRKEKKRNN
jgi:hypothetical protein